MHTAFQDDDFETIPSALPWLPRDTPHRDAPRDREAARILVIDHDTDVLDAFRHILSGTADDDELVALEASLFGELRFARIARPGFAVDVVPEGSQGRDLARNARREGEPYAVAFVGLRMPSGWDGLHTVRELWRVDPNIQVVICTAGSDHASDDLIADLGHHHRVLVLRRPFDPIEVLQMTRTLSEKWQLEHRHAGYIAQLEGDMQTRLADLQRANRTLRMLTQCNETLVRSDNEQQLLEAVCRLVIEIGDYRAAWVHLLGSDGTTGTEPLAMASRCGTRADECVERIELPLRSRESVLGTLTICAEQAGAFCDAETRLLQDLADDVGYGIVSLRADEERKRFEQELERRANFDTLTGLANRSTLETRVTQSLADSRRYRHKAAVLFVDLDRFKDINDRLSHSAGDRVLVEVARRLQAAVRECDTVARLGGDEFVLFITDVANGPAAATVAAKVLRLLGEPLSVDGEPLRPGASIGISLYPDDGDNIDKLLKNADLAMYHAKSLGGTRFRFFATDMNTRIAQRFSMEADLRRGIEHGELLLHYQPQMSLSNGTVTGAEALVRWLHPQRGMVPPSEFIRLAEDTGLIQPLGEWVLNHACAQMRAWLENGLTLPSVAVNLSVRQFADSQLVPQVRSALREHRLAPALLELEITEAAVMQDADAAITTVQQLKALGVRISLDDFGTGYSSLSHLKRLPFDHLKIDRSFVKDIGVDVGDAAICDAVIRLGHSLGLSVIAEGVETEQQLEHLRRRGCDEVQGRAFSDALPAHDFAELLRNHRPSSVLSA